MRYYYDYKNKYKKEHYIRKEICFKKEEYNIINNKMREKNISSLRLFILYLINNVK